MSSDEFCPIFVPQTVGLDEINAIQGRIQDITMYTIFATLLLTQCIISLILLPIPRIRGLITTIDITPTIKALHPDEEDNKEAKRLSGGVATIIIITAAIILFIIALNSSFFASGTIVGMQNDVEQDNQDYYIMPQIGLASKYTERLADVSLVYTRTCGQYPSSSSACTSINSTSALSIQIADLMDSCDYYATVCARSAPSGSEISLSLYAPINPPLAAYPPAGVFGDTIQQVTMKRPAQNTTIPAFATEVTLIKTVNSQALAFLSLSKQPRYQIHISPAQIEPRALNSTVSPASQLMWPECNNIISVTGKPFKPAYSFHIQYTKRNLNTKTVTIEEHSFSAWILTTVLTIGSTVALQPSIRNAIIKVTDYWKNKAWVQWVVFLLVIFIGPLFMSSAFTAVNNWIFLINGVFVLPLLIAVTYHHVKFASR
jgi:hypothetical protein